MLVGPEGLAVRVQRLVMPVTGAESWTVLDDELAPVEPAERFLAHLSAIERSPNTVRAYAHSLVLWFEWLGLRQRGWDAAGVEDVSEFVRWLRAPADNVIVLDVSAALRSEATVNRHLAAVFSFYDHHARAGVVLSESLVAWRRVPRGSYKPFLHHVTAGRPIPTRPIKLRVPRRLPGSLTIEEVTTILAACTRLRDRFLFALNPVRFSPPTAELRYQHVMPGMDEAASSRFEGLVFGRRDETGQEGDRRDGDVER